MNKNKFNLIVLLVSIILSLAIGFYFGTKNTYSKVSSKEVLATYTLNGSKKNIELKDITEKSDSDYANYDRMAYQQKRQAIFDFIGEEIKKTIEISKIQTPEVSSDDFEKMLVSLKIDKKKLTEKQKSDIMGNMAIAQRNQKIKSVVEEEQKNMDVQLQMDPPFYYVKRQETGPLMIAGDSSRPIEFIFYGNMHYPQCLHAYQGMMNIESQFPRQFRIYFKYLGLEPDQSVAFQTAKSLYCLTESQKKSGLVNQLMKAYFEKSPDSLDSLSKIISANGVSPEEMRKCLFSKDNNTMLRIDAQAGQDLNRSLAAFYVINNRFVHGAEQNALIEDLIKYLIRNN